MLCFPKERHYCWVIICLFVLEFNAILTAKIIIMAVTDVSMCFLAFLTPLLSQVFFPESLTTILTCNREERQRMAGKKVCRQRVSNPQPSGQIGYLLSIPVEPWSKKKKKKENTGYRDVYSPTILKNFFCQFSNICKFECNTTSDWLNRMV